MVRLLNQHIHANLETPWLPDEAKIAHIVPGLVHSSLVFIKVLYAAGCKVMYEVHTCNVYFNEKILWQGVKEPTTGIWVPPLDLTKANSPHSKPTNKPTKHTENNA